MLLPDFAPATTTELGLAVSLHEQVADELDAAGHIVLTSAVVRTVIGSSIDSCFDDEACPMTPLQGLPARLAVMVRIVRDVDRVLVQVAVYDESSMQPIDTHQLVWNDGEDLPVVQEIVAMLAGISGDLPPVSGALLVEASTLVSGATVGALDGGDSSSPKPIVDGEPDEQTTSPLDAEEQNAETPTGKPDSAMDPNREGADSRFLVGVRKAFIQSGMDLHSWMASKAPHGGRLILELRGGVGIGDVDRHADAHVTITADGARGWYQEGPNGGTRVRGAMFIGYAPSAWLDIGVVGGLQYGEKTLVSGWTNQVTGHSENGVASAQAVQLYVSPQVRTYLVPSGLIKPFVAVRLELRAFDRLKIVDSEEVNYPDPAGGLFFGPGFAAGMNIDPDPMVGLFVEGSYTHHLGLRSGPAQNDVTNRPSDAADGPTGLGFSVGVVGGVQFRL